MSINNNNIWELAENYLSGSLSEIDNKQLKQQLQTDLVFAAEFNECINLINSIEGSEKQKRFKNLLEDIHQSQVIRKETKKAQQIWLTPQVWRTAAIAASVAILTSTITIWSLKPSINRNNTQYSTISREVAVTKKVQAGQQAELKRLKEIINEKNKPTPPPSDVRYSGTGFAITNDGYFVTANHVIHNPLKSDFDSVYIQNHDGQYFKAFLVAFDPDADIAILKVEKKNFRFGKGEVPYTFAKDKAPLGGRIFTIGYPNEDEVYSEGYISGKNGIEGDQSQYTLQLPASHGQSGSPVINDKGNILGILTAIGGYKDGNDYAVSSYAVSSNALIELLHKQMPDEFHLPRTNKLSRLSREEQIQKMEPYTVSVKVYKK